MFKLIRQSHQHLRPWLMAAAAVLLLVSVLEAGHVHGTFTPADDHCTLCQHSVGLDDVITTQATAFIPLLLATIAFSSLAFSHSAPTCKFAPIRAPPFARPRI